MKTNPLPYLTTEQKNALQNESSKSVIIADMDGNVVAFNPGAQNIFGYSEKEAIGLHVRFFHPPQNYARILPELFRTALQKGKYDQTIPLIRKNGQEFPGHIVVTQIKDEKNQVVGLMGVTEEVKSLPHVSSIQKWVHALRAPFFSATLIPVFLGTAIAFYETGIFHFWPFAFTTIAMVFIHAGVNLANDYFDGKSGADALNTNPTPFSGGSRVIQDGIIPAHHIKYAFLVCLTIGSAMGLYLNSITPGNGVFILGILGIGIGLFYSAPPLAASYKRFGELFVAIGFGPLIVVGASLVQTHAFSWVALAASLPMALLIAGVLFLNQFPDAEADTKAGKRNWVNTLGKQKSVGILAAGIILSFLLTLAFIAGGWFPAWALATLAMVPLSYFVVSHTQKNFDKILELLPANAGMITLNFCFGILLTLSFLAASFI